MPCQADSSGSSLTLTLCPVTMENSKFPNNTGTLTPRVGSAKVMMPGLVTYLGTKTSRKQNLKFTLKNSNSGFESHQIYCLTPKQISTILQKSFFLSKKVAGIETLG